MTRHFPGTLLAAAVGLTTVLAGAAGCRKGTYLEVRFTAAADMEPVNAIRVLLTLRPPGGAIHQQSDDTIPPNSGPRPVITFPTSMLFSLDTEEGDLRVDAEALSAASGAVVAMGTADTTIRRDKTWQVEIAFAGAMGNGQTDAGTRPPGFVVVDGSIADGFAGCPTLRFPARDSVSLDYNSAGPAVSAGNFLFAHNRPQQDFVGWLKFDFDIMDVPAVLRANLRVTAAWLNLAFAQASGSPPKLVVQYSSFDGWTRADATVDTLRATKPLSATFDAPQAGSNQYTLAMDPAHDWGADLVDGLLTVGIDNTVIGAATDLVSDVDFYGVDPAGGQPLVRPTLDLTLCRQ